MIDIETLSTQKNASIIEIGAVEFNKETGEIGEKFDVMINPYDWGKNDRHIDGETIKWWFSQSNEARERYVNCPNDIELVSLNDALVRLRYFIFGCDSIGKDKNVIVWGNGASFDIAILEDAYNHFKYSIPWKYWCVNDVRTIVNLNPSIKMGYGFNDCIKEYQDEIMVKHSPVSDCIYQIGYVTKTINSIKNYGKK